MATTIHEAIYSAIKGDATALSYTGNDFALGNTVADTVAPYTTMNLVADPNFPEMLCYNENQGQARFQFDIFVNALANGIDAKWDGIDKRDSLRKWVFANLRGLIDGNITITRVTVNDIIDRGTETDLVAYGFEATFDWRYE